MFFIIIIVCTNLILCFEMCEYIMLFLSSLEGIFNAIAYCVYSYFCGFVDYIVVYLLGHIV